MTTYKDIQAALTGSLVALNTGQLGNVPISYYARDFDPQSVVGDLFVSEAYLFDQQQILSKQTIDEVRGIYQLSVYLRDGSSISLLNDTLDKIISNYPHNKSFVSNGQKIVIIDSGRNGGSFQQGWFAVDVSINFKSDILRA